MAERGIIFKDDFVSTPGKSWFDMSFDFLFSMNFGELVPSTCMECMGGDVIHAKSDSFVRLAPLVAPTFGKANMFSYHFYVRNYSIWKNWRAFYAEGDQRESWQQSINGSFVPPEVPYISIGDSLAFLTLGQNVLSPSAQNVADMFDPTGIWPPVSPTNGYYTGNYLCNAIVLQVGNVDPVQYIERAFGQNAFVDNDKDNEAVILFYMPNKYDTDRNFLTTSDYYNPYSNGTLFDYLGVDLSGLYAKQFSYFQGVIGQFRTALNDSNPSIDVTQDVINGFNVKEFLSNHLLVGVGYLHNKQLPNVSVFCPRPDLAGSDMTNQAAVLALNIDPLINRDSKINSLPLRAYHSIYIDYFRDENYVSVNPCIDFARDGYDLDFSQSFEDVFDYLTLNIKAYEHDPYTTALPQAQRGQPVRFLPDANPKMTISDQRIDNGVGKYAFYIKQDGSAAYRGDSSTTTSALYGVDLSIDLSAATIENFRFANATQKLLEKIARSGNRYYEYMKAIYGVIVDDAKIDRPIFLGGDKSPIQISEVLQTSASELTTDQPLGQMAGRGVSVGNDDFIEYFTPDAGFFIEICCALPRTNYQQGLAPMFHRFDRLDFAIPDYAQLGEQQVPQRELWYSANDSDDETPFGYQSRYYDYKYQRDRTSGSFKDSLSFWTWSRIFDGAPLAGKEFIEVRPDYRQFAVTDKNVEHIYVHMWHDIQVNRCLPVFGTPKL